MNSLAMISRRSLVFANNLPYHCSRSPLVALIGSSGISTTQEVVGVSFKTLPMSTVSSSSSSSSPFPPLSVPPKRNMSTASDSTNSTPLHEKESDRNFLQQMWDRYSITQQTNRILVAESFLQAATRQASDPRWFSPGHIGRDFRSFQALVTMHIWFLHKRLISNETDPHVAAMIQQELFDIFWTDTTCRMRAHGVNEWLVNKNLKTVQQYSFMHCFQYDHCYTTPELLDDPKARLKELKALVQTHILLLDDKDQSQGSRKTNKNNSQSPRHRLGHEDDLSERLAWYIEAQYQNIVHDLPDDDFWKGRVAWVDLPNFDDLTDGSGNVLENVPVDPTDVLPDPWIRNIANDGSYYYWNGNTREARWELPTK